jgi:CspA family cold shock protein
MANTQEVRKIGCVKWFNSTRGYGFITNIDGEVDKDLFVHHSALSTKESVYKTLSPGEYVNYSESLKDNKHYAVDVTGIKGGKLLCENKIQRKPSGKDSSHEQSELE